MEKLRCPECGEAVLPEAEICENCGCKITVCPDCGWVYKAGQARCTECGRVLSEDALDSQIREDTKKIETRIDADVKRGKSLDIVSRVIGVIGLLFLIAPFIIGQVINKKDELERLALLNTVVPLDKALWCIGLILYVPNIEMLGELLGTLKLCGWVQEIKFDYREYIRIYGRKGAESGLSEVYADNLSKVALLLESKKDKTVFKLMCGFRFAVAIIILIAGSVWIDDFINQLFDLNFSSTTVEWATAPFYVAAIVLGVSIVIRIVYYFIHQKRIKNKKQEILNSVK